MMSLPDRSAPVRLGLIDTFKAVGASFFGVRGRGAHERDFAQLNPLAVIAVGLFLALAFVLVLVAVVRVVAG
jgi:hypothetical protein